MVVSLSHSPLTPLQYLFLCKILVSEVFLFWKYFCPVILHHPSFIFKFQSLHCLIKSILHTQIQRQTHAHHLLCSICEGFSRFRCFWFLCSPTYFKLFFSLCKTDIWLQLFMPFWESNSVLNKRKEVSIPHLQDSGVIPSPSVLLSSIFEGISQCLL